MIPIMDASFREPRAKNWTKRYVQLDFSASIRELEKMARDLREESEDMRELYGTEKDQLKQIWCLAAFLEKCGCKNCKAGWKAFDEAYDKEEKKKVKE